MRNETIKYSTFKKKNKDKKEIKETIQLIENELCKNNSNSEVLMQRLFEQKQLLDNIIDERINGSILRSKAIHVEGNEKNTKYFANLEKKQAEKKTIHKLKINNAVVNGVKNVLKEEVTYYKRLYEIDTDIDENVKTMFLNTPIKRLSDEEKQSCEGMITIYECENALREMKNNKSPGSDGLTVEFNKLFWNDLKMYLVESFNYSYQTSNLTVLQKQGIISLIPKPNKDLENLANWRPITLLNIDYKIATKTISNRLKKILPIIVDIEQSGFIKGRYIGENVRLIIEVIEYLRNTNKRGLLFLQTFKKHLIVLIIRLC